MQNWPSIDPGEMVHQVSLLQAQAATDISGTVTAWVPFATIWAAINPVRGTDVLKSGQATTQLFLTVKIWWMRGVEPNMRVQSKNGTYIIQSVENPGERNVILVLNCLALGTNQ
jgi:SPP1 family predicted phage head-tail adaptor